MTRLPHAPSRPRYPLFELHLKAGVLDIAKIEAGQFSLNLAEYALDRYQ
jgi:hypothetical protein